MITHKTPQYSSLMEQFRALSSPKKISDIATCSGITAFFGFMGALIYQGVDAMNASDSNLAASLESWDFWKPIVISTGAAASLAITAGCYCFFGGCKKNNKKVHFQEDSLKEPIALSSYSTNSETDSDSDNDEDEKVVTITDRPPPPSPSLS